jgi:predicted alpha-1,2-mannosidase
LTVILVALCAAPAAAQPPRVTSLVDPFIGTGGHGHTYPGPSLPFGMIQPGPDTRLTGWDGCSGYHYSDSRIYGFSHTHLSGTGIPDYTDVLLMPGIGDVRFNNGADGRPGYSSAFSHDEEVARPGYYAVTLRDPGIRAELTTTVRVGVHRYTLPAAARSHVVLDLEHRDRLLQSSIEAVGDREIVGLRRSTSWARDQLLYFVIRFSRPFERVVEDPAAPAAKRAFIFSPASELIVKVSISAVSVDGARRNMDAEVPGWNFDDVRRGADDAWSRELSKIQVEGGSRPQQVQFYTALYHSMLAPNVYMDVDGQYRGRDLNVHRADGFTYYSVFSLWDTFRALHPLLTLIDQRRTRDFIRTFLVQFDQGGRLPVWELAANETDTMIGYHAVAVIADAIVKGVGGFDIEHAYRAMRHSAGEDRFGLRAYRQHGFIDASEEAEGVSRTLEYAYDDWTIAQVARLLKRGEDEQHYLRRAQSYKHLFDPSTGFMRARVEGLWHEPFDPAEVNNHYTEANAWQYSFFVPHDIAGLMQLHGGPQQFARKLDALFAAPSKTTGRDQADITGLIGQYAHGNEPSHHMAYLYAFAGEPWKTQGMVRRIIDTQYRSGPDGLSGNEDCGQMSAWLVFSALGFYPVTPGSEDYVLTSPLFDRARIHLENGRTFTVTTRGLARGPYVQAMGLNTRSYERSYLSHRDIIGGGELVVALGPEPNREWGSAPSTRPRSAITKTRVAAAPFVAKGARLFRGRQDVALGSADPGASIFYTLDGSDPGSRSLRYAAPIQIERSSTLKAVSIAGGATSPVMAVGFRQLTDYPRITLSARYAPQYAAAGDDALIDGLRGNDSFRTGRWQGYRGTNLDVTLDLGEMREVQTVTMGFLQDVGSWILMPRRVVIEVSEDGRAYRPAGTAENVISPQERRPVTTDFVVRAAGIRARYVRARVETHGRLPDWHPGAGEQAWFFSDEIIVR